MKLRHKIQYILWSLVVAIAMTNDDLRREYNAYLMRAWEFHMAVFDAKGWLHRRWFPQKYAYEYSCPDCAGYPILAGGLCSNCGKRFDISHRPAKPL